MTTPSLTVEQAIGQLRLTDEQLRIWRKVTLVLGFRNVGKALSAIAPRRGAVKGNVGAQAAKRELTDDELDDLQALQERVFAAEMWFDTYPAFHKVPLRYRTVTRKRTGHLARGSYKTRQEQIGVNADVAAHLRTQGIVVDHARADGERYWADCEDQAWGQDVFLEEWFGARAGTEGHTFDDLLPMFRKALALKAELPRLQARMREIEVAA